MQYVLKLCLALPKYNPEIQVLSDFPKGKALKKMQQKAIRKEKVSQKEEVIKKLPKEKTEVRKERQAKRSWIEVS